MPFGKILLRPGVNTQQTPMLNEASWSESNLVRFFQGLLQKIGGWQRIMDDTLTGVGRALLAWADLLGTSYVAAGTSSRLQVDVAGNLYDITPIRATDDVTPDYTTTVLSTTVEVVDTSHGAEEGDGVIILNPISVGGIVVQGIYTVESVIDANTFTIDAATAATSSVANGGTAAEFNTTNGSSTVQVTLADHGYAVNDIYIVQVSTSVGGLTLFNEYVVNNVIDADNFEIDAGSGAGSTTSGFENGGNSRIQYMIHAGLVDAGTASGYGTGGYGYGPYGIGGPSTTPDPLRQWSLDAWGEQLLASPSYESLYVWDPTGGTFQNPATLITQAPAAMTGFFVAMPQQQVVTYGATDPSTGNPDPMLVRWCDVADYTVWTASSLNQAGSYRLPRGSKIISGIQGPQYGLLWTDLALWQQQYVEPPFIYGFNEVATGCSIISMRARCILGTQVVWCSQNGFFLYSGGNIIPLECPVWDIMFQNLYSFQADKIFLGASTPFNEFYTFFPSLSGSGEVDTYLKCNLSNVSNPIWDYGSLVRTAWIDQSVVGNPIGVDESGLLQQHEVGNDADGEALLASATSGWFKLNDGQLFIFIERMIPDFVLSSGATVNVTVYTADYPEDTPDVYGPYDITSSTEYIIVRSRSRLARVKVSSNTDLGTFWRLGEMLYMATPAGSMV